MENTVPPTTTTTNTKLAVVIYLRNNEDYLDFINTFFPQFEKSHPNIQISYYAYENNSKDNTRTKMSEFMSNRPGIFMYDDDEPAAKQYMSGVSPQRIQRMVRIRNKFLDHIRDQLTSSDYVLFVDTDVMFSEEDIEALLQTARANPDIAMLTCNTKALYHVTPQMRQQQNIPENMPLCNLLHYYDTYAFIDSTDVSHYPACCFPECRNLKCADAEKMHTQTNSAVPEILNVRSAWGGCVLIDATIFKDPHIRWGTIAFKDIAVCEHVYFCDAIRLRTNRRIVILTKVSPMCLVE